MLNIVTLVKVLNVASVLESTNLYLVICVMSLVNPCGKRDINPFKDNSRAVFWIVKWARPLVFIWKKGYLV